MDLIGQREHLVRVQDMSGDWLSRHALDVLSHQDVIRAGLTTRYAALATVYEVELTRLLGLFDGAGSHPLKERQWHASAGE